MGDYSPVSKAHLERIVSTKYEHVYFMSAPDLVLQYRLEKSGQGKDDSKSEENLKNEDLQAWLVLLAVFMFNVVMGYHFMCFGMYYVTFTETFESTKAQTGFIGSIHSSMGSFFSLFASVFMDIIGMRKVAVIGCILTCVGVFASSFAQSVYFLYVTYGLVTGFGISFAFLATQVAIQKHFNKHRNIATSIAVCGLPLGNLISPFITNFFLDMFGWRGALAMHSAVVLHTIAFAMLCGPPRNEYSKHNDNKPKRESTCKQLSKDLIDLCVVRELVFVPLIFGIMFSRISITAFFDHLASRTVYLGASLDMAGYMITIVCIGSLVGRLLCSIILGILPANPLIILSMALFIQGFLAISLPLCKSNVAMIICIALFGLMQGFLVPLILLSIVKVAGVNKFGKTRAMLNIFGSITSFTATPLTGWMFDVTQNYDIPFFFSGSVGVLGSLCMFLVLVIYKVQKRNREQTELEKQQEQEFFKLETARIRTFTI